MVTEQLMMSAFNEFGILEVPADTYRLVIDMQKTSGWSDEKCIAFIARILGANVGNIDENFDKSLKK
jgi:hypothetical protein